MKPMNNLHIGTRMIPELMQRYLGETITYPTKLSVAIRAVLQGRLPERVRPLHFFWYGDNNPKLAAKYPYFRDSDKFEAINAQIGQKEAENGKK
jgi:hypothetical protein